VLLESKYNFHLFNKELNCHITSDFRPYLTEDSFDSSMSVSWEEPVIIDLDNLGGRLKESLTLYARSSPYIIHSDITVMPEVRNLLFCEFICWYCCAPRS
jgi:hypothetical protein